MVVGWLCDGFMFLKVPTGLKKVAELLSVNSKMHAHVSNQMSFPLIMKSPTACGVRFVIFHVG